MIFLFILESIGTPELILIAVVALIVFGPRKLPGMAKTIGKTMAEFRKATTEFKTTWEKEAALETETKQTALLTDTVPVADETTSSSGILTAESPVAPKVKELSREEIRQIFPNENKGEIGIDQTENQTEKDSQSAKRNWL